MKAVLKKGSIPMTGGVKSTRPSATPTKTTRVPANPYKLADTGGKSNSTVWMVVGVVAVVVVLGIMIFAGMRGQEPNSGAVAQQPDVQQSSGGVGQPYAELGGKTMAEASAEGARNSKLAQERAKARSGRR